MRRIVPSLASAAVFLSFGLAHADATDAAQNKLPTAVDKPITQIAAGDFKLPEGTFKLRPGLPPIICTKPLPGGKIGKIGKLGQIGQLTTPKSPQQLQYDKNIKDLTKKLQLALRKAAPGRGLRADIKAALGILGKLKNPCGPPTQVLYMGTSARCQGSSTDP